MKGQWTVALALLLYLSLSLYQIQLPGLYYDEAADAVPTMQLLQGQPVELLNGAGIWLGGRALPIMVWDYVGAVNTYALLPFFALLGVNVFSLRLMTVAGGVLTLLLTYQLARELFPRGVAAVSIFLLAVHPSFVFWNRQGIHVTSLMTVMALGASLCLLRWRREGGWGYLMGGAFLLGLGLSAKLLFLWFVVAVIVAFLIKEKSTYEAPGGGGPIKGWHLGPALVAFLAGTGMLLLYNLETGGTLNVLGKNLMVSQYGVSNLAYLTNLRARLDNLGSLLDGGHLWYLGGIFQHGSYPILGVVAAGVTVAGASRLQGRTYAAGVTFLLVVLALYLLQSAFTISGLWPTHLFLILPLLMVMTAVALYFVQQWAPYGLVVSSGVLLLLVSQSMYVNLRYHQVLGETGGRRHHSDAIYRLADYLVEANSHGAGQPMAMDWGIKANIQILTQGKVNPQEIFQYTPQANDAFRDWLYGALHNPDNLYLFHTPEATVYPRFEAFRDLAVKLGNQVHLEATVRERDGTPLYLVYSAR
ncbi:MAG: glycosyltransferase family 39 protein [Chloroflexi bacterium]|nr:glycosyltransferase family 39 protein [Chloroflexota bacterium]